MTPGSVHRRPTARRGWIPPPFRAILATLGIV